MMRFVASMAPMNTATTDVAWNPDPATGIRPRFVQTDRLRFEVAEAGDPQSDRLALCLHGFPELNISWRNQIPLLAQRGYRVWAPNLRGYGATDRPEGVEAYRLNTLLADIGALIDAAEAEAGKPLSVTLIAHDWGAVIAWQFAIKKIRPLTRLVIMNVPHPICFGREIQHWHQKKKSWYIFMFQLPRFPEWVLTRNKASFVRKAFTGSAAHRENFTPELLDTYTKAAQRPGAANAMVNYYRGLKQFPDMREVGDGMVHVPTLMIWGTEDVALDIRTTDGSDQYVPDLELHKLEGISHWVQQDAPVEVNAILSDWLNRRGG